MNRYRIVESVGHRTEAVHRYEDLEIHHPSANARGLQTGRPEDFEKKRLHERVEGTFEEVRHTSDGRTLVKKDFILAQDVPGPVRVPAPVDGHVHYLHDATRAVRFYDRPSSQPGARLLAQSLHMDPRSFSIPEGGLVAYGQPVGTMSDSGTPGSVHAHVEVEADQFRRYIRDIDNGAIAPGRWPGMHEAPAESVGTHAAPSQPRASAGPHSAAHARAGHAIQQRDPDERTRRLQHTLNALGARDESGHPLVEDGRFGRHTREAVDRFQADHGVPVTGHVGPLTRQALESSHGLRISDIHHPDYRLFEKALGLVAAEESRKGIPMGTHTENLAAALVVQIRRDGLDGIDRVDIGNPPRFARAMQLTHDGHERFSMPIETKAASNQSLHASSDMLAVIRHMQPLDAPQHAAQQPPAKTMQLVR